MSESLNLAMDSSGLEGVESAARLGLDVVRIEALVEVEKPIHGIVDLLGHRQDVEPARNSSLPSRDSSLV